MTRIALALALAHTLGGCSSPSAPTIDSGWDIRSQGFLASTGRRGGGNGVATRATNPTDSTRRVTIVLGPPGCEGTSVTLTITNHHGKKVFDGAPTCDPHAFAVPAGQHVDVKLYGRGTYDLTMSLR